MIRRIAAIATFAGVSALLGACFVDADAPIGDEEVGSVEQAGSTGKVPSCPGVSRYYHIGSFMVPKGQSADAMLKDTCLARVKKMKEDAKATPCECTHQNDKVPAKEKLECFADFPNCDGLVAELLDKKHNLYGVQGGKGLRWSCKPKPEKIYCDPEQVEKEAKAAKKKAEEDAEAAKKKAKEDKKAEEEQKKKDKKAEEEQKKKDKEDAEKVPEEVQEQLDRGLCCYYKKSWSIGTTYHTEKAGPNGCYAEVQCLGDVWTWHSLCATLTANEDGSCPDNPC